MNILGAILKRSFDLVVAGFLLLIFWPLILLLYIMIYKVMGSPVFFKQVRPGKNEKLFTLCKFRTMKDAVDKEGVSLPDADRLTDLGRFIRKTSLDELPQLFNVIKGDMSLVGPRPLLVQYLPLYNDEQKKRHNVRPGITGWAQVNGRNAIDWDEKFKLDVWYVENRSFFLDLKILYLTVLAVMKPKGISQAGHATMPEFKGSKSE